MTDQKTELQFLLDEVASVFGGRLETTTDFDALSESIDARVHQRISSSTLKRLWGYVNLHPRPRTATLDILSQYVGRASYRAICNELNTTSGFISAESVDSGALDAGMKLRLRWMPDRCVLLQHKGSGLFCVLDPGTSKLRPKDFFHAGLFIKGHPLYIDDLTRDGKQLPPYVAGRSAGITCIETVK